MLLLTAVVWAAGNGTARAELPSDVPDRVRIAIGGLAANAYTEAALGSTTAGLGASVNFEDVFDLPESKETWRFELNWRLSKRQVIDLGYLQLNRSGSRALEDDVEWGRFIFHANAKVTAGFDTRFPYAARMISVRGDGYGSQTASSGPLGSPTG
jgi:hypothetical protein